MLNATGAEIAKKVDFDRTNISRIKSGKRIPHPDSATAKEIKAAIKNWLSWELRSHSVSMCNILFSVLQAMGIMNLDMK